MDNIFNSIVGVVIGVFMIIAWLPTIFFTEINNKGNRLEMVKLKEYLNKPEFKTESGILTGTNITSNITYNTTVLNLPFTKNDYIYIYYTGTLETTTTTADNKKETKVDFVDSKNFKDDFIKWNEKTINNDEELNHLSSMIGTTESIPVNINQKLQLTFYGIKNNTTASEVSGLKQYEDEIDMKVFDYELGGDKETVIKNIINRKSEDNMVQKWLGRIGTFLLLGIGLMALISPLRYAANIGNNIPVLNVILTPFRWLVGLYDIASILIAIILTVLMTLFVYALVNYPIISLLLGGLMVGLKLYLKK
jgi:hypothetical protein